MVTAGLSCGWWVAVLVVGCGTRGTDEPHAAADPLAAAIAANEYPRTTSVLASQHGAALYEGYFGGATADTLHDVRSVTKSLAALAVGIAIAEGKLPSEDAPAFAYLADLEPLAHAGPAKSAITIRDLLTMSSALDCDDDVAASPGNEENMYPKRAWARWAADLPVRAGTTRGFAYCTAGVFLLGRILERATGEPIDRYLEQRLLAPLGIERVVWNRSPAGEAAISGQLQIRTRDLAKLATLLVERGRHGERQLVPAAWIDRMLTRHTRPSRSSDPRGELGYGYLMWQREYTTSCGRVWGWYMSGNGGTHAVVLPTLGATAVVTRVHFNTRGMHDQTTRLLEQHVFSKLRCPS